MAGEKTPIHIYTPDDGIDYKELRRNNDIAIVIPGQGYFKVGMGKELCQESLFARQKYQTAERVLGYSPLDLDEDKLSNNEYLQVALMTYYVACADVLKHKFKIKPRIIAGHSLGEVISLVVAGAIKFEDGLKLAQIRGRLMHMAAEREKTGKIAIIQNGQEEQTLEERTEFQNVVQEITGLFGLTIGIYNNERQIVVGGRSDSLNRAKEHIEKKWAEKGYKTIPLNVKAAYHSEHMRDIVDPFAQAVAETKIRRPEIQIIANTTGEPLGDTPEEIRKELVDHLTMPVQWEKTNERLIQEGITTIIELGEKPILTNLVRKRHEDAEKFLKVARNATILGGVAAAATAGVLYIRSRKNQ